MADTPIKRALVSVTDKTGVVAFVKALEDEFGVEVISTGGTARVLEEAGVHVVRRFTAAFSPVATTRPTWPRPPSTASA